MRSKIRVRRTELIKAIQKKLNELEAEDKKLQDKRRKEVEQAKRGQTAKLKTWRKAVDVYVQAVLDAADEVVAEGGYHYEPYNTRVNSRKAIDRLLDSPNKGFPEIPHKVPDYDAANYGRTYTSGHKRAIEVLSMSDEETMLISTEDYAQYIG